MNAIPQPAPSVPMTFGQILDRTYQVMRANFRLFLCIAAIPAGALFLIFAPVVVFMLIATGPQLQGQIATLPAFPVYLLAIVMPISYVALFVVFALYLPAASYAVTQADLGIRVTFTEAYAVAWRRFGRYLWLMILGALYVIVPVLASVLVIVLGAILLHASAGESTGPGAALVLIPLGVLLYFAALVYSILIMLRFSLAYPACVVEGLPAWPSLKRSGRLTEGAKGRIFLVLLIVYALTYIVSLACIAVFCAVALIGAMAAILAHVTVGSTASFVLIGLAVLGYLLVIVAASLFSYAAYTTALGVLYHDQRLRKDGPAAAPVAAAEPV